MNYITKYLLYIKFDFDYILCYTITVNKYFDEHLEKYNVILEP